MDAATRRKWLERARQAEAGRKAERAVREAATLEGRLEKLEAAVLEVAKRQIAEEREAAGLGDETEGRLLRLETALAAALERIAALEARPGMFISPASDEAAIMNIVPEPPPAPPAPAPRPAPPKPRPPAPARVEPERELVAAPAAPADEPRSDRHARIKAADPIFRFGRRPKDRVTRRGFSPDEQAAIEAALQEGKVSRAESPDSFSVNQLAWRFGMSATSAT